MLSATGLVAMIWASAALATPLIAKPILPSTDLAVRDSDLEVRQFTSKCPPNYTSKNGLNFTMYCNQNNPFNDAHPAFPASTMEECLEKCSRYNGNKEGCFGIVWSQEKTCWLRNSSTSTSSLKPSPSDHSALVDLKQMKPLNTACPGTDREVKNFTDGIGYTIDCNKDIPGEYDTCWKGYPYCDKNPFQAFHHATSLEECLSFCLRQRPLCQGAIYNPGLELGFANCWPKTGFQFPLVKPDPSKGVIHSATITGMDSTDTTCPKESLYTSNSKGFEIHCGQLNTGSNITSLHTQNVTSCIDKCASSDQNCVGILFDSSLRAGFYNCYLQNSSLVISDQPSATYAVLSNSPLTSGSGAPSTSPPPNSGSSSSQAWIAGPVIGGVAALAILGFGVFWWRRRKNRAGAAVPAIAEKDASVPPVYYEHSGSPGNELVILPSELEEQNTRVNELAGEEVTKVGGKYAPARTMEARQEP